MTEAEADELHAEYKQAETDSGDPNWRQTLRTLERAENTYPRDRKQAHTLDETELGGLRSQHTADTGTVTQAAQRLRTLQQERDVRAEMPAEHLEAERHTRNVWREQQQIRREQEECERARHEPSFELDQHLDPPQQDLHRGLGGPSLGL